MNHPFIQQLIDKHKIAVQNNSKEVRLTITELGNLVNDIHLLFASVYQKNESHDELKMLIKSLLGELKVLNDSETDGGLF